MNCSNCLAWAFNSYYYYYYYNIYILFSFMKLNNRLKIVSTLNYGVLSKQFAQLPYLLC